MSVLVREYTHLRKSAHQSDQHDFGLGHSRLEAHAYPTRQRTQGMGVIPGRLSRTVDGDYR